ncbi:O-methyltransferase [Actinocorallia longicatena]|uniref:Class I SAM-dependent methyltransferase n=1 Tax=Actinocorallia longicatena TaxID=111803 RepID=A0ABP6QB96_9ACTN
MAFIDPLISDYLLAHSTAADDVLRDLAEETHAHLPGESGMQISHDEGEFLTMLVQLVEPKLAVEVGVFTGYSSICIARGLPAGGRLLALDVSDEWTSVARRYWKRAGVEDRIELRLGPAADSLRAMPEDEPVDFAFIDADKTGYPVYYEELLKRLRPGGILALDNVLRDGRVVDPDARDAADLAIKDLNDAITADTRVTSVMLPLRDGVTIVRKR